jgi:hypothetical protein
VTSVIALANGTLTSCWDRYFCFRSRRRTAFILWGWVSPCCSLTAPSLELLVSSAMSFCAPALLSMCYCAVRPPVIVTGTPLEGVDRHSRFSAVQGSFQPHLPAATSLLPFILGCERDRAPWRLSGTSSSFSRSMWCRISKDASWACMTSSPMINLSVILATNTQVVSGRRPRVIVTKAYLKVGRVSPDGGCRVRFVDASLARSL